MERQRQQVAGQIDETTEQKTIQKLLHVSTLLKPCKVINPYATQLHIPDSILTKRRANIQFLSLISTVTLLHQYQRRTETHQGEDVLITDIKDIEIANDLVKILLANKADLLGNGERRFYERLKDIFQGKSTQEFSTSEASKKLRTPMTSVKRYIKSLKEKGYLHISGGDRYKQGYTYRIEEDGDILHIHTQIENILQGTLSHIQQAVQ